MDGSCIQGKKCDKIFDCIDGGDENDCEICNIDEFSCGDNVCIPEDSRCDGRSDCSDGSDERDCGMCFVCFIKNIYMMRYNLILNVAINTYIPNS